MVVAPRLNSPLAGRRRPMSAPALRSSSSRPFLLRCSFFLFLSENNIIPKQRAAAEEEEEEEREEEIAFEQM